MDGAVEKSDVLLRLAVSRLRGVEHRLLIAEVTEALCDGNPRWAERRFGWGRETIRKGQREWQSGLRCVENFVAPGATGGGFGPPVLLEEHWRAKPLASGTRSDSQQLN